MLVFIICFKCFSESYSLLILFFFFFGERILLKIWFNILVLWLHFTRAWHSCWSKRVCLLPVGSAMRYYLYVMGDIVYNKGKWMYWYPVNVVCRLINVVKLNITCYMKIFFSIVEETIALLQLWGNRVNNSVFKYLYFKFWCISGCYSSFYWMKITVTNKNSQTLRYWHTV